MAKQWFSAEQIVVALRQIEVFDAAGQDACFDMPGRRDRRDFGL